MVAAGPRPGRIPDDGPQNGSDESKGQIVQAEGDTKTTGQPMKHSQNFIHSLFSYPLKNPVGRGTSRKYSKIK